MDSLISPEFEPLWKSDIGSKPEHKSLAPLILVASERVREAYRTFGEPTDTLVTKVLLGTFGCLPACDRFFIAGFRCAGFFVYSWLNPRFVDRILQFSIENIGNLQDEQNRIKKASGVHYPLMKLVDMYFWQIGYESSLQMKPA